MVSYETSYTYEGTIRSQMLFEHEAYVIDQVRANKLGQGCRALVSQLQSDKCENAASVSIVSGRIKGAPERRPVERMIRSINS